MKTIVKPSLAALCLAVSLPAFSTIAPGFYGGLSGFVNYTPNLNFNVYDTSLTTIIPGKITYSVGGGVAGQLGYRCEHFRGELEILGNYNKINKLQAGGITLKKDATNSTNFYVSGQTVSGAGFINGFFDFNSDQQPGQWSPFIGLGIGAARVNTTIKLFNAGTQISKIADVSSTRLAGQGIIGIGYALDNATIIGMNGRYMGTQKKNNELDNYSVGSLHFFFSTAFDNCCGYK